MAMYSEAYAEGKASPGRSIGIHTTWGMHCEPNVSRMHRDAPRQNCEEQRWCYAMGLHIHRGHTPGFHIVHSLAGTIIALFAAAIAFTPTRLQNHRESLKKSEVLKFWTVKKKKKDTAEEPECRVTLAKEYIQALF